LLLRSSDTVTKDAFIKDVLIKDALIKDVDTFHPPLTPAG